MLTNIKINNPIYWNHIICIFSFVTCIICSIKVLSLSASASTNNISPGGGININDDDDDDDDDDADADNTFIVHIIQVTNENIHII